MYVMYMHYVHSNNSFRQSGDAKIAKNFLEESSIFKQTIM